MTSKKYLICLWIIVGAFLVSEKFGYAYNITDSLPHKHFLIIKNAQIKQGSYILFSAPKSSQYEGLNLIKKVVGKSGAQINVVERDVYVDGMFVGQAKSHSKSGAKLAITINKIIPKNQFFVANTHIDSYDSRYLDFGLIDEKDIIGVAFAIW